MNETKNKMVLLAEQLRELTHGICTMGPGPYGIGVSTDAASSLRAVLQLSPDPFLEENFGMSGEQECKADAAGNISLRKNCGRSVREMTPPPAWWRKRFSGSTNQSLPLPCGNVMMRSASWRTGRSTARAAALRRSRHSFLPSPEIRLRRPGWKWACDM